MVQATLLTGLAMGNWGSTPSPDSDTTAPRPVGNEGELKLTQGKRERIYALDVVRWAVSESDSAMTPYLKILGEPSYGQPEMALYVKLPVGVEDKALLHMPLDLLATEPGFETQAYALFPDDDHKVHFEQGSFTLIRMTGSGPWQIDAEIECQTEEKSFTGFLKSKLTGMSVS